MSESNFSPMDYEQNAPSWLGSEEESVTLFTADRHQAFNHHAWVAGPGLPGSDDPLAYDLHVALRLGLDVPGVWRKACVVHRQQSRRMKKYGLPAPAIKPVEILRLWNAAGWRCVYTWQVCATDGGSHPLNMTLDHIVALKHGAPTSVQNLVPASHGYNQLKADRTLNSFLKTIFLSRKLFDARRQRILGRFVYMAHQAELWANLMKANGGDN